MSSIYRRAAENNDDLAIQLNKKTIVQISIQDAFVFDFAAWAHALKQNRTLEEVTVSVFGVSLGTFQVVQEFFEALGSLPKLRQLAFRKGVSGWHLNLLLLCNLLQQRPQKLKLLHLQDVEFRGECSENIQRLADSIKVLPRLQQFTMAHCCFNTHRHTHINETPEMALDPLLVALLLKQNAADKPLKKAVISATRVNGLGRAISQATLRHLFVAPPPQHSPLEELRLLKFDLSSEILTSLLGFLLAHHSLRLQTLLLSSCQWDSVSLRILCQFVRQATTLKELHLLGNCDYLLSNEECHAELAQSLQFSRLRRFFLEPLQHQQSSRRRRQQQQQFDEEELEIPRTSQRVYVQMLESNFELAECRIVTLFQAKWHWLMAFYLGLNQAGRRTVCFHEDNNEIDNIGNDNNKEAWMQVLANVNDNVARIYYFLSLNPSLCAS